MSFQLSSSVIVQTPLTLEVSLLDPLILFPPLTVKERFRIITIRMIIFWSRKALSRMVVLVLGKTINNGTSSGGEKEDP